MGHESILRATRRVAHTGMFTPDAIRVAGLPERTVRRILGLPPVNASVGRGRKPRIRPILNADGERIGQTHIRGAFPGFAPGRCPRTFRGCQSPRARSRRAAKAAKLMNAG